MVSLVGLVFRDTGRDNSGPEPCASKSNFPLLPEPGLCGSVGKGLGVAWRDLGRNLEGFGGILAGAWQDPGRSCSQARSPQGP